MALKRRKGCMTATFNFGTASIYARLKLAFFVVLGAKVDLHYTPEVR